MRYIGANELREMFLSFWESKGSLRHESYSLVPHNDKSLLIINSGMAPLKPYFAGTEVPPSLRMVTCQKCIRTGDIDNVGYTARHATFFEMMGNFSFGDYFKRESLVWGWEFVTGEEWLAIPPDKVWATVYIDDDEAYDIWKNEIGLPEERIVRLGKADNFWEIGTGPCGPCSEVYYDRGPEHGCGSPDCKPGCECDRYMEFWNHVFTQFNHHGDGEYSTLEKKNIDTGMGLERIACVMQGVDSIYSIDTMQEILQDVVRRAGKEYQDGASREDVSIRIITDHIRAVVFLISDGVLPSNEGRGYVLRRLLRRAARHGRLIDIEGAFLYELADKVVEISGDAYPNLRDRQEYIKRIIRIEEEKFAKTLAQGMEILDSYIEALGSGSYLSGDQAFRLYDTYGFPIELTEEIAGEAGCSVDKEAFERAMDEQKEMARAARKSDEAEGWLDEEAMYHAYPETEFIGYDSLAGDAKVLGIVRGMNALMEAGEGEEVRIVLDRTPFYAEGGGQVGDKGRIFGESCEVEVEDTIAVGGVCVHRAKVASGEISEGESVRAEVDFLKRNSTARNHSATHLLHKALQTVLGSHVAQAGSHVDEDMLRFDFTHFEALTEEEILKVEQIVNEEILRFTDIKWEIMEISKAKELGAAALFGEKYGNEVRVVSVPGFSAELCGGTHVANTGQIGAFRIISEAGVAAGVRRIEALTGLGLRNLLSEEQKLIDESAKVLKTNPAGLVNKIHSVSEELRTLRKELEQARSETLGKELADIEENAKMVGDIKLISGSFEDSGIEDLRLQSDRIKASEKKVVMVFAALKGDKTTLMVSVSDDLLDRGIHAGKIVKELAAVTGGGGGGKADMAQAGVRDRSKLSEAFELAAKLLAE